MAYPSPEAHALLWNEYSFSPFPEKPAHPAAVAMLMTHL